MSHNWVLIASLSTTELIKILLVPLPYKPRFNGLVGIVTGLEAEGSNPTGNN